MGKAEVLVTPSALHRIEYFLATVLGIAHECAEGSRSGRFISWPYSRDIGRAVVGYEASVIQTEGGSAVSTLEWQKVHAITGWKVAVGAN